MDAAAWNDLKELERAVLGQLSIAMADGDVRGPEAEKLVAMHRHWVGLHWGAEPEDAAYLGLCQGYLADPRFVAYCDKPCGEGATEFLVRAVDALCGLRTSRG